MKKHRTSPTTDSRYKPARPFNADEFGRVRRILGGKVLFVQGDAAVAYGALLAGCRFFAGYPITPATETSEILSQLMPRVGGVCIQMEDEIASVGAIIGASRAGVKSMTATSGPGFSLMQENIGYAAMTETPCVIVDVQRSGPSTGQPTEGAQGDIMQAKWGSHGDYELIALSPSTVQECLDLTIEAFNLSETYGIPVILLTDGIIGHMREKVVLPEFEEIELTWRREPTKPKEEFQPFLVDSTKIPEMAIFGTGYHTYITGLTHSETGYPATDSQVDHHRLVQRLCDKIRDNRDRIVQVERDYSDGDKDTIGIVSYGVTSRSVNSAVKMLRQDGLKIDHLRLVTNWPFPEKEVAELSERANRIVVPELNLGQVYHGVREAVAGRSEVIPLWKTGGEMHVPHDIVELVKGGVK
ncbi:MAG: 2-oxoacid:acceptor oxidoreductase subunit alpha [Candidatus Zixiibacteriota bacterium]|nr:MAG: 2-oxoacid:acceptor oxidoreductase subunit alpha [candidate division Zixibacteria bacterium]